MRCVAALPLVSITMPPTTALLVLLLMPAVLIGQSRQPTSPPNAPPRGGNGGSTLAVELFCPPTQWQVWWELNSASMLRVRDHAQHARPPYPDDFGLGSRRQGEATHSLAASDRQISEQILPALKRAIDASAQRDINCACMIAMAKIGRNHVDFRLIDVFSPRLRNGDQEVRETAALSIGIAGIAEQAEIELLIDLATDNERGRAVSGGNINYRTRAFAAYGLGLLAHDARIEIKAKAFATLRQLLMPDAVANRDLAVAAIKAIGVLHIDDSDAAGSKMLGEAVTALEQFYLRRIGAGQQLISAHCPTEIARLLGRDHRQAAHYKELFASDLQQSGTAARSSHDIARSCALALGQLAAAYENRDDKDNPDNPYSRLLLDTYLTHHDQQTRYFSILALGQIGGALNRINLLKEFDKADRVEQKAWVALSLGISAATDRETRVRAGNLDPEPDRLIGSTLASALAEHKDPDLMAALAISLGLARATDVAPAMVSLLNANVAKEGLASSLCIGLALMQDHRATPHIWMAMDRATRRPELFAQAASALARLGDKNIGERLVQSLPEQQQNLAMLAATTRSLQFVGDAHCVTPLTKMLLDQRLSELARSFAAVALGGIAARESLPWNSKLGEDCNYRATVDTLTNRSTGVLDIF